MKKIGVIGESPHDTKPMCEVLEREYAGHATFRPVLQRIKGGKLDSITWASKVISAEVKTSDFDLYLFMRDLDGFKSDKSRVKKVKDWYKKLSANTPKHKLLLCVQEMEAYVLSDIDTFNKEYKTKVRFTSDPEMKENPKEFLKLKTSKGNKKYHESDME